MWSGVRKDYEEATMAGMEHFQYNVPLVQEFEDVKAYIRSLKPEPSPYLIRNSDGGFDLSAEAKLGEKFFNKMGCLSCHPRPLYTDLKMHNVGTRHDYDRRDDFDTPALVELWRTSPYLHDGSLESIREVVNLFAPDLKEKEKKELTLYLLSL